MGRSKPKTDLEAAHNEKSNDPGVPDDTTIHDEDEKERDQSAPRPSVPPSSYTPPNPSISLLFLFVPTRQKYLLLLPACLVAIIAGGVAPFMTIVLGQGFQAFSEFAVSSRTSQEKSELLHKVGLVAIQLIALGAGAIGLSSLLGILWILVGERNMLGVRKHVYDVVTKKDMAWFDLNMRADLADPKATTGGAAEGSTTTTTSGAAGLMARFSKETDEIREASSLSFGIMIQNLTTTLTAIALAFRGSWSLTLITFSTIPIIAFIQGLAIGKSSPYLADEKSTLSQCADHADRSFKNVDVVKAFNAVDREEDQLLYFIDYLTRAMRIQYFIWGAASGSSQFLVLSTFVTGFWYGAFLVRTGRNTPGDVMSVFWACLIASDNLQLIFPRLNTFNRGKVAMVSILNLINTPLPPRENLPPPPEIVKDFTLRQRDLLPLRQGLGTRAKHASIRKIVPSTPCRGSVNFRNVTFAYPSRPLQAALNNVEMFFPAGEVTYVVGPSGSGKSTVAALLTRLYTPQYGVIELDDQTMHHLDPSWTRSHIFHVSQNPILFSGTVAYNVAMGLAGSPYRKPSECTRAEIVSACKASALHEFIKGLENGYETIIGSGGLGLSGGQKQRLALARARLRDPTILILDEATAALDPVTKASIWSSLLKWRKNRTTIVITHDLASIGPSDFVYVLNVGQVVERGYRNELPRGGGFYRMLADGLHSDPEFHRQPDPEVEIVIADDESRHAINVWTEGEGLAAGGFRSVSRASYRSGADLALWEAIIARREDTTPRTSLKPNRRISAVEPPSAPPLSWYYGNRASGQGLPPPATSQHRNSTRSSGVNRSGSGSRSRDSRPPNSQETRRYGTPSSSNRPYSVAPPAHPPLSHIAAALADPNPSANLDVVFGSPRSRSNKGTVARVSKHNMRSAGSLSETVVEAEKDDFGLDYAVEKRQLEESGSLAGKYRSAHRHTRIQHPRRSRDSEKRLTYRAEKNSSKVTVIKDDAPDTPKIGFWTLIVTIYKYIPSKRLVVAGVLSSMAAGAMTPFFSWLLARLLFEVSVGAREIRLINIYGGVVLAAAFANGLFVGLKYIFLELAALGWMQSIRPKAYTTVLSQDKKWFDKPENKSERLVHVLFTDGMDAKELIATILGQAVMVIVMVCVGLIWALVAGWQLTLAGFAIGPIFAIVMGVQATLVERFQKRNHDCREEIAKGYYETISNIRGIRAMAFEDEFRGRFEASTQKALKVGARGALIEGCNVGIANGLIYFAEALLFWVGAVLVAREIYTYIQMVVVLQLVVFTVSIAGQLLAFTGGIGKALQAARQVHAILTLPKDGEERHGDKTPEIHGNISFRNVEFAYPSRPKELILKGISLDIKQGECIALVGGSGSGKSTITSLLMRLYQADAGSITVEGIDVANVKVEWLRDNISIVMQNPNLFDMTVIDNIAYGSRPLTDKEAIEAAQASNADEFILDLPEGYETQLGANADLLSGGQAQRIAIARALVRGAQVLILDECTSALDPENQAVVMEAIRKVRLGRTIIMITHKVEIMKMCDRILVVDDGVIAEQGTFDSLMSRKGVFTRLATAGELTS